MKRTFALLSCMLASFSASAGAPFSYDYVDIFYNKTTIDKALGIINFVDPYYFVDGEGDAFGLSAAKSFGGSWFLAGDVRHRVVDPEYDGGIGLKLEQRVVSIDVGNHWSIGASTDFTVRLGAVHVDDSVSDVNGSRYVASETGFRALVGLRHAVGDAFELHVAAGTTRLDQSLGHYQGYTDASRVLAEAGVRYRLSDRWSLGLSGSLDGDTTEYGLALRADL